MTIVIKRDGREVEFNKQKIIDAILGAMKRTEKGIDEELALKIANSIEGMGKSKLEIEQIQDLVESKLMASSRKDVAKEYIIYRNQRSVERMKKSDLYKVGQDIIDVKDLELIRENANLKGDSYSGKLSKFGSEFSKWYTKNFVLPPNVLKAIEDGYLHIHDLDHYIIGAHNCLFIPFGKLMQRGFSTGNGSVRPPNSIWTAMAQVAIIFQSQQNAQYGGVGANMIDWDLAPYVTKTFVKKFKNGIKHIIEENSDPNYKVDNERLKNVYGLGVDDLYIDNKNKIIKSFHGSEKVYNYAYSETVNECYQGAESMIHNLNTMSSRAGNQIPFSSINYGTCTSTEGRMVIESLLKATIAGLGNGETPIFPIQIFKCRKGVNRNPEDINYDMFLKAIECSSKRLYPNFVNLDAPYNSQYIIEGNPDTEVSTMG